jgi:hypothetical protein
MVEATPAATLVVTEADFLLEFEIVALNPPTQLGLIDHALERDVGRQRGEPIVIRFGRALRPLDQQPLLGRRLAPPGVVVRRADPPSGKPRGQWRIAAVPPRDRLPGIDVALQSQGLGRDGTMRRVAAPPLAGRPRPALDAAGNGASPGRQTIVLGRMPATWLSPSSLIPARSLLSLP